MSDLTPCVIHAAIAGLATIFAIAALPPLAGVAVYSGLLSLAYGIRWATRPAALAHPSTDPDG